MTRNEPARMATEVIVEAYRQPADALAATLGTDPVRGLDDSAARSRLATYGPNELPAEKPVPGWRKFLAQLKDVLVLLLLGATAISVGLWLIERESALPYEAMAILAVVLLNAAMGYLQQARAEAALAALQAMTAAEASVIRGGHLRRVPAVELVRGDVMQLEEGDAIAADGRVVASTALTVAEAALTGESVPVTKDVAAVAEETALGDRHDMVFAGTAVTFGRGRAIVTATGATTEMGHIAGLLKRTSAEITPLQRELDRAGKVLGIAVAIIAVVMIATLLLVEDVQDVSAILEVLILGVALAVAAVPEGLPAVVTAVLSIGVQRMARRNAIVRHLAAVESLGSATVIASDKTGTLTLNAMTVRKAVTASGTVSFTGTGYAPDGAVTPEDGGELRGDLRLEVERALAAADRANNASVELKDGRWTVIGDPTEAALLVAARKCGFQRNTLDDRLPRVGEVPFSSERKLMSTVHRDTRAGGQLVAFTKGAPDVLLARCSRELVGEQPWPLTTERRAAIHRQIEQLANEAMRTLGVATRRMPPGVAAADDTVQGSVEEDLVFAGLLGMIDPPRPEAKAAVAVARRAGIRPVMITGDHPRTASVIARELGISDDDEVITGAEIERLGDHDLAAAAADTSVYARVSPAHKLRIIDALRRNRQVVAMTGDGVNDAPALKAADIGVAMGITGTEVAKKAADIVLVDDNFASIVAAVEEGRAIFANIRKFLRYLLASNIGEVLAMFFGVLFADALGLGAAGAGGLVLPLIATQILWVNLVSDGAPALALGVDPAEPGLMDVPPRRPHERVISPRMWLDIVVDGAITAAGTLLVLDASMPGGMLDGHGDLRHGQTMAFTTLVLFQLVNALNARSDTRSAFVGWFTNRLLWAAIALSLLLQVAVVYLPVLQAPFGTTSLAGGDWLRCALAASSVLWAREAIKAVRRAAARRRELGGAAQRVAGRIHGASAP